MRKKPRKYKIVGRNVYVVYQCMRDGLISYSDTKPALDGKIHGVYMRREDANKKRKRIVLSLDYLKQGFAAAPYIAVLEMTLKGDDLLGELLRSVNKDD